MSDDGFIPVSDGFTPVTDQAVPPPPRPSFPATDIAKSAAMRALDDVQNPGNMNVARLGAEVAPIVGGTMGAAATPFFPPLGMAAGGAAGEAAKQGFLQLTGEKPIDAAGAAKESLKQGAVQGLLGTAIEGAGSVLGYLKDKILPTVFNTTANVSPKLAEYFVKNPNVINEASGSQADISNLVGELQDNLKNTRETIGGMLGSAQRGADVGMTEGQSIKALANNQLTIKSPSEIAQQYLAIKNASTMGPDQEIPSLYSLRNSIDDKLHFSPPGTVLGEAENRAGSILKTIRGNINDRLDALAKGNPSKFIPPNATAATLRDMDSHYQNVANLYDSLRGSLGKEGAAEDVLKGVFTNDTGRNRAIMDSLQKLDQMTGQDMTGSLMKQFTAQTMNQMVGKKLLAAIAIRDIVMHGNIGQGAGLLALSSPKILSRAVQLGANTLGPMAHILGDSVLNGSVVPTLAQGVNPLISAIKNSKGANSLLGQTQNQDGFIPVQ